MKNYAIILASGTGARCNKDIPKQFIKIGDKTILERTLDVFEKNSNIDGIVLVINEKYIDNALNITKSYKKILKVISGGQTRKQSSYIGVNAIEDNEANVLIHDCARPFLSQKVLNDCIEALSYYIAVVTAIPSSDTIIEIDDGFVKSIPDRKKLMRVQTPQCFRLSLIKKAHELSLNDEDFTDDCGLILKHNLAKIHIVKGEINNIKITYAQDIKYAQCFEGN